MSAQEQDGAVQSAELFRQMMDFCLSSDEELGLIRERDAAIRRAAIEECATALENASSIDTDTQYSSGWYAGLQAGVRRIRALAK